MTQKYDEPPPPFKIVTDEFEKVQFYHDSEIELFQESSIGKGYKYIPGKAHADVVEALIGIVYLKSRNLEDCQALLYSMDILKQPNLKIQVTALEDDR